MDSAAATELTFVTTIPHIELLYSADCPSHDAALQQLRRITAEEGLDPATIDLRLLLTATEANAENFPGSPTIRINGIDIIDPAGAPPSLSCRVYRHRNGRFSPLPEDDSLRQALRRAKTKPDNATRQRRP